MSERTIEVVADPATLALTAARHITAIGGQAIAERGTFSIALSGGSTPKALLQLLAAPPFSRLNQWPHWEVYFGDERCVPPKHADSNYRMAREALLEKVPIDPSRVHRMKGEIDPQQAAKEYGQLIKEKFGETGMDLILLGMGDDGHTASLFPQTTALKETKHRCVANFVAKMNTWRITLTVPFINRANHVMIMVAGAAKAGRIQQVLEGPADPMNLPIQFIQPVSGQLRWLLDAAAAGMVEA